MSSAPTKHRFCGCGFVLQIKRRLKYLVIKMTALGKFSDLLSLYPLLGKIVSVNTNLCSFAVIQCTAFANYFFHNEDFGVKEYTWP